MSLQLTNATNVAFFDGVTGMAVGPTFESEEHAEDFLRWLLEEVPFDPRGLRPETLRLLREQWFTERVDGETGLLLEEVTA